MNKTTEKWLKEIKQSAHSKNDWAIEKYADNALEALRKEQSCQTCGDIGVVNDEPFIRCPYCQNKEWELIPCEYSYMGMRANAVENPEVTCSDFMIGTIIDFKGSPTGKITRVELEGRKENLEYVLRQQKIIDSQILEIKQLKEERVLLWKLTGAAEMVLCLKILPEERQDELQKIVDELQELEIRQCEEEKMSATEIKTCKTCKHRKDNICISSTSGHCFLTSDTMSCNDYEALVIDKPVKSYIESQIEQMAKTFCCEVCGGSGVCQKCKGEGSYWSEMEIYDGVSGSPCICNWCKGSGKCHICQKAEPKAGAEFTNLKFDPENPECTICHTTLMLEDGCEWSVNPIENICRICALNLLDSKDEQIKAKDLEIQRLKKAIIDYGNNPAGFDWGVLGKIDEQETEITRLSKIIEEAKEYLSMLTITEGSVLEDILTILGGHK